MTKAEKIIELLKMVDPEASLWGLAVAKAIAVPEPDRVVNLIIELRSQARDNEPMMKEILGAECYAEIMSI